MTGVHNVPRCVFLCVFVPQAATFMSRRLLFFLLLSILASAAFLLSGCASDSDATSPAASTPTAAASVSDTLDPAVLDTATFAGGCFWCMEPPYDRLDGVVSTTSGFSGGDVANPSYRDVAYGRTKHTEAVQVVYNAETVDYRTLLRAYWHNVDPLDGTGQFCDRGSQYRPAIFAHDAAQRQEAEATLDVVKDRFGDPIAVEIVDFESFYSAEDYHQDYYQKNPTDYKRYRRGCRRDARLQDLWGEKAGTAQPLTRASS